ncbi:MAG: hypothetical protein ACK4P1_08995, partial [Aggregatilineales bacterium]
MRFDLGSFLIGLLGGLLIAFGIYRLRDAFARLRQRAQAAGGEAHRFFSAPPEVRYARRAAQLFNAYHLGGDLLPLRALYLEPHFLAPPPLKPDEEEAPSVASIVPILHDFPAAYAPYNLETLSLLDLQKSERHLALLARSGMGKSTALALLGLMALGEIVPTLIDTSRDEYFERSLAERPPEERERLRRQYQENQRRALEKLNARFKRSAQSADQDLIDFRSLLPILVHLRDIDVRPTSYGVQPPPPSTDSADAKRSSQSGARPVLKPLDPAEPLVKALQRRFGGAAASQLPKLVYRRLAEGSCLVLIDGYDELPELEKPEKLTWLSQFMALYAANVVIVAADVNGYDPLAQLGFQACYLRAWREADFDRLAERWAEAWSQTGKGAQPPDPKRVARAKAGNRGRTILDVTLKIWSDYADDLKMTGRLGWY